MSESMVERVARAIMGDNNVRCMDDRCGCAGYERWECALGTNPHDMARAAIEAMREPTDAMRNAKDKYGDGICWGYDCHICGGITDEKWRSMIDAALKGEG